MARTRIAEPGKSIKETKKRKEKMAKIKEQNDKIIELNKNMQSVVSEFMEDPKPFFEKKSEEVANLIMEYGLSQQDDINNGSPKKDYAIELSHYIAKPFIPYSGCLTKYTANTLLMANDFYWEQIVLPANKNALYVPMLHDLLGMLSISTYTFNNYAVNGDEKMREACQIIYDQFIAYYQRNGMQKNISEIMSMFVLKTTYKQHENESPQVITNIAVVSPNEKINEFAKKYNFKRFEDE